MWKTGRFVFLAVHLTAAQSWGGSALICIGTIEQTTESDVFHCLKLILALLTTHCLCLTWHKNETGQWWLTDFISYHLQASSRPLLWATLLESETWSSKVPMQNDSFSDEEQDRIDSFPLFQSFFHSGMEIKLLETPWNFGSYLWADKRHFILRSESKVFQFLFRCKGQTHLSFLPRLCLVIAQP